MERTVEFVCEHGAGNSRVAAALFNAAKPRGWRATSAGVTPQETVSVHAARLLAGDPAAEFLDVSPPNQFTPRATDVVVGIDCDVPDARLWKLASEWPAKQAREELRVRVTDLIAELKLRVS
ncbi:MAG: hypothetical protein ACRDGH_17975 [Candidatus Limnocylindria bacterium]